METRWDIRIEITYSVKDPDKSLIRTNAKEVAISEILEGWIRCQLGKGEDRSKAEEKDVYQIVIELDMSDDTFRTTSNTGNEGLTAGIILDIIERLDKIEIIDLEGMQKGKWRTQSYDTFEGEFYGLHGGWGTEKEAKQAAKKRLQELEKSQPSAQSGGQSSGGIQDQVFIVRPDGSRYRFTG